MTELTPVNASTARYLWTAVGVLGATTIALGAIVLNPQWRTSDVAPVPASALAASTTAPAPEAPKAPVALSDSLGSAEAVVAPPPPAPKVEPKSTPALEKPAQAAPKKVAKKAAPAAASTPVAASTAPVPAPSAEAPAVTTEWPAEPASGAASAKAGKVVCAHCGTVQSVTPVQRDAAKGSGVGVLVGGALGGLLGNQVGGGTGKTVATVLGAVGGGWAGNEVEKRMKKDTVYQVTVRMQDGSTRQIEQHEPIAVGAAVTVEGDVIRPQFTPE